MKKFLCATITVATLALATSGCVTTAPRGNTDSQLLNGTLGGIAGYLITGELIGTALGVAAGVVVGNALQAHMDDGDRRQTVEVTRRGFAAPPGGYYENQWNRGDNRYHSRMAPGSYYRDRGQECRHFTQVTEIYSQRSGRVIGQSTKEGVACLSRRGEWVIRN